MSKWSKSAAERYGTPNQAIAAQMRMARLAQKEKLEKQKRRAERLSKVNRALKSIGL